ncbi:MAG: response regulator [Lachnospiraceae bacterium]|nr:response regulator [Lachnospiraceae bacterium]
MEHIKLFIADDNRHAIEALKVSIMWEKYGLILSGTAENGPSAIRGIKGACPDIVMIDIQMPGCSGLEVIEACKEEMPDTVYILISAYDSFEYAKKGIELGVTDYLLKPYDKDELDKVLEKSIRRIRDKRSLLMRQRQDIEEYDAKLKETKEDQAKRIMMSAINGAVDDLDLLEAYMNDTGHCHGYAMILIHKDEFNGNTVNTDDFIKREQSYLDNLCAKYNMRYLTAWIREGMTVLIAFEKLKLKKEYDIQTFGMATELFRLNSSEQRDVFIGISDFFEDLKSLQNAVSQAVFSYESRFFMENKNVIHYESMRSKSVSNEYMLSVKLQELYRSFENPDNIASSVTEYTELVCKYGQNDVEYIRNIFMHIAIMLSSYAKEKLPSDDSIKSIEGIITEVKEIASLTSLCSWMKDYASNISSLLGSKDDLHLSVQTKRALEYINCHYMEHISLKDTADECGVSESYLCRNLKIDTGETFVNLLNKIRIQKAIELLKEKNLKVYEIAEVVGYSNYAYFYQMFKKVTGCTPTEYETG